MSGKDTAQTLAKAQDIRSCLKSVDSHSIHSHIEGLKESDLYKILYLLDGPDACDTLLRTWLFKQAEGEATHGTFETITAQEIDLALSSLIEVFTIIINHHTHELLDQS